MSNKEWSEEDGSADPAMARLVRETLGVITSPASLDERILTRVHAQMQTELSLTVETIGVPQAASPVFPVPADSLEAVRALRLSDLLIAFGEAVNASLAALAQQGITLLTVSPKLAAASDGASMAQDKDSVSLAVSHLGRSIMLQLTYLPDEGITEFAIPFEHRTAAEGAFLEMPLIDVETRKPVADDTGHVVRLRAGPARGGFINLPNLPSGQRAIDFVQLLAAGIRESGLSIELN